MTMRLDLLTIEAGRLTHASTARIRDEMRAVHGIAAELAAHRECTPADYRWWCDAVQWSDRLARPEDKHTWRTIATLARDAGIIAARLMAGSITDEESARCAALLTDDRDRAFGRILGIAEAAYRERDEPFAGLLTLAQTPEARAGVADAVAGLWAQIATFEEARAPLLALPVRAARTTAYAGAHRLAAPDADTDTLAEPVIHMPTAAAHYALRECGACAHRWRPRVPRPAKCPRCQRYFTHEAEAE